MRLQGRVSRNECRGSALWWVAAAGVLAVLVWVGLQVGVGRPPVPSNPAQAPSAGTAPDVTPTPSPSAPAQPLGEKPLAKAGTVPGVTGRGAPAPLAKTKRTGAAPSAMGERPVAAMAGPPPPVRARAAMAAPVRSAEPVWNAWFERGGQPAQVLLPDAGYELVVDLSRYRYFAELSGVAGAEVQTRLEEARGRSSVRFKLRAFALDGKLHLSPVERDLDVALARLFGPPAEDEPARVERYVAGALPLAEFARSVQAGEARFNVVTRAKGCAAVALSIWDETGLFPLDHLVVSVPVAAADESVPPCGAQGKTQAVVEKDAATLLHVSIEHEALVPAPVASFHLFETQVLERRRTVVWMVDRHAWEVTGGRDGIYTWLTESLLSDYLVRPEQLRVQLEEARRRASAGGYAAVARELAAKLFSQEGGEEGEAERARQALTRAVARSAQPAVVIRMVTASGERAYLPLGLLAARADAPVLTRRPLVLTPLPLERYPGARACIARWTLAVPERLEGVDAAQLGPNTPLAPAGARMRTEQELLEYMADATPATEPEGLILLAHHAGGYLWFADKAQRVGREAVARRFPPGSVALLSACTTAAPEGDNLAWLNKLNRQGMDAMVVSPFPVPAGYAARLTLEFAAAVQAARTAGTTPTLLELFEKASQATADHFRAAYGAAYDDLALEFVLAGDPGLRLCPTRGER